MKKILYPAIAVAFLGFTACSTETKTENTEITKTEVSEESEIKEIGLTDDGGKMYGEAIDADNAISVADMTKLISEKESMDTKIKAEIVEVCQNKGCWVTVKLPSGEDMRVKFGEDAFFVPKNSSGKTAIMEGTVSKEVITVDEQRHYLEDAGKPQEEIMAITTPDTTLSFNAKGIIVYN